MLDLDPSAGGLVGRQRLYIYIYWLIEPASSAVDWWGSADLGQTWPPNT